MNPDTYLGELYKRHPIPLLAGVLMLGIGMVYWFIARPIHQIELAESDVTISLKAGTFGLVAVVLPLVFLLFHKKLNEIFDPSAEKHKNLNYAIMAFFFVITIASYQGLKLWFESHGVRFGNY